MFPSGALEGFRQGRVPCVDPGCSTNWSLRVYQFEWWGSLDMGDQHTVIIVYHILILFRKFFFVYINVITILLYNYLHTTAASYLNNRTGFAYCVATPSSA